MSQPPKSTIFAPSARWASLRMVFWVMGPALGERPELSQMESAAGSRLQAVALVGAPDVRHRHLDQALLREVRQAMAGIRAAMRILRLNPPHRPARRCR